MAYVDVLSNPDSYNGLDNARTYGSYEHCIQSSQRLLQEGLEVTEAGKAVKVQTDKPHLVSLGSGRLSTSVTLHPLQDGLTRIGTSDAPVPQDIIIAGTGVDKEHCYIDNNDGIVNLHPISTQISIDGMKITAPTRLSQGCMICLGRSNYFRFNHPQEAQMMRNIFPNSRISVFPINFNQDVSSMQDILRSPLNLSPKSNIVSSLTSQNKAEQFRDEFESEDFVEKVSKFEYLAHSKQPTNSEQQWWFVKEGLRFPQHNTLPRTSGISHVRTSSTAGSISPSSTSASCSKQMTPSLLPSTCGSAAALPPLPPSKPLSIQNSSSAASKMLTTSPRTYSGLGTAKVNSPPPPPVPVKPTTSLKTLPPSPKLPTVIKLDPHISPKIFLPMATATNQTNSDKPRHLSGRCTPTYHQQNGLGNHCSLEDLRHCERELQMKHQQVVKERLQEQELGKQEQQRLEEILNMCAEYERQVQLEKNTRQTEKSVKERRDCHDSSASSGTGSSPLPSPSHTIHMNRIKTNGSLPRDKVSGCLVSPRESLSPVHPAKSFKSTSSEDELEHIFDFSSPNFNFALLSKGKNKVGIDNSGDLLSTYATYPQSPRTHIKTVVNKVNTISAPDGAGGEIFENQLALTISDDQILSFEKNASSRSSSSSKSLTSLSPKKQIYTEGRYLSNNEIQQSLLYPKSEIMSPSPPQLSPQSSNSEDFTSTSILQRNEKMQDNFSEKNLETLRFVKINLMQQNSDLKTKILELESQEEEALHEFEVELALLDGEYRDKQNVLQQQQNEFKKLRQQERELTDASESDRMKEQANIIAARKRVEELERNLVDLEKEVGKVKKEGKDTGIIVERIQRHHEMLETERKTFEDLEFHLLEHDAHREEEKEQIIQKLNKVADGFRNTEEAIADLVKQKNDLLCQVKKEISITEQERQMLLLQYKMDKQKLNAIEMKLGNGVVYRPTTANKLGSPDGSPRSSDGELQNKALEEKLRQLGVIGRYSDPEDLISKVSASVSLLPKEGTASVRTAATLQEIERSRQKMLEVQGALVIEQERRRVEEIKRRVANEVCMQWQERKLREASSLPSSESERSSASSSDIPAESITSDEAFGKLTDSERNSSSVSTGKESDDPDKVQQREQKLLQAAEDMRPLSGSSSQEDWMDVKLREKHRLQRPLTRYLPVRSDNFNLKQHIETAGHQIDQCPQVQLGPSSCRGYLHKMGSKFKTWNKRWFVFDRSKRTLVYYGDKHEHKPRGGVYFQAIEEVYVDHLHSVKSPNPKLTFCVKTLDRTYYLMAPNAEAMRIWVDVIFTGAEGYREFQLEI